eukprot:CAMPEP_0168188208 /NCGR_PEP_ID=MMETSP0139_2-20121125/15504_1 /TAXON_ID=44445 /ORGANISM="Pseudo-nitzschia australis, Strain 10249 10 AB" /LENGTH=181 /DNA_ID=CAMNT_0008110589 /DNA_START=32 /DNA_END=577 /DNA_ORIENTATION=+
MAAAVSMIAEKVLNACCGDKDNVLPSKKTSNQKTEEKKEGVDPHFKRKFLNQDMKFELSEWKKLPPKARKACEDIGYDESKWDNNEEVDVSWKHWGDLTDKEREAVEILGWEETAWEEQYQWTEWNDLPKLQKKAAKAAGYTEDSWQESTPEGLDEWWDELDKDKKEAMCVMGWTKAKWDE